MHIGPRYRNVTGSEYALTFTPVGHRSSEAKPLVLFSHGRGGDAQQAQPSGTTADPGGLYRIIRALVDRGYVVASFTFGSTSHWGRPAAVTQLDSDLTWAAANLGVAVDRVAILAYSMGWTLAHNWGRQNLGKVAALVGVAPGTNIDYHYTTGGLSAEIDAAWSTWASAGGNTHDPIDNVAALNSLPALLYGGASDTVIPPGDVTGGVQAYASAYGVNATYAQVAGTHDTLWQSLDPEAVARFIHEAW